MFCRSAFLCFVSFVFLVGTLPQVEAHEIRPAIVTAEFSGTGLYKIEINANLEALITGISATHKNTEKPPKAETYDALRQLPPAALSNHIRAFMPVFLNGIDITFDDRPADLKLTYIRVPKVGDLALPRHTKITLTGTAPAGAPTLTWRYAPEFGDSVFRVQGAIGGEIVAFWLKNGDRSPPIRVSGGSNQSFTGLAWQYVGVGFTHIIPFGLDHILFVLGLYFLSSRLRPLIIQVSSFTVAHTLTLALSMLGLVSISPAIIEPLIALSIVFVAVENWITDRLHPWRPFLIFGFGLIHGFGFAGVLREINVGTVDFATSLVFFNVGVELGQLAVIAIAYAALGFWVSQKAWYRSRIVRPLTVLIGATGFIWFLERVL